MKAKKTLWTLMIVLFIIVIGCSKDSPTKPDPPPPPPPPPGIIFFDVSNAGDWNDALNSIKTGGNDKTYQINVLSDFDLRADTSNPGFTFGMVTNITVTIIAEQARTINLKRNEQAPGMTMGRFLFINIEQTVNLENITVNGVKEIMTMFRFVDAVGGEFNMVNSTIRGNFNIETDLISSYQSQGVLVAMGTFTMTGSTVTEHYFTGVNVTDGTFVMSNSSTRESYISKIYGGVYGVLLSSSNSIMNGGSISENYSGGGVTVAGGTFTMNGGTISNNQVTGSGGGIALDSAIFNMNGGSITGNSTERWGGGVYVENSTFNMNGGIISRNVANDNALITFFGGGGLFVQSGFVNLNGGTIYGGTSAGVSEQYANISNRDGDAIYAVSLGDFTLTRIRYSDGTDVLPHTDGFDNYTNHTVQGK